MWLPQEKKDEIFSKSQILFHDHVLWPKNRAIILLNKLQVSLENFFVPQNESLRISMAFVWIHSTEIVEKKSYKRKVALVSNILAETPIK